ncbi:MAG: hypothetical protein Q9173_003009 [Seirophora scorigena]
MQTRPSSSEPFTQDQLSLTPHHLPRHDRPCEFFAASHKQEDSRTVDSPINNPSPTNSLFQFEPDATTQPHQLLIEDWPTQEPELESPVPTNSPTTEKLLGWSAARQIPSTTDTPINHRTTRTTSASPTPQIVPTSSGQAWVSPGLRGLPSSDSQSGWADPFLRTPSPPSLAYCDSSAEGWASPGLETPPGKRKRRDSSYFAERPGDPDVTAASLSEVSFPSLTGTGQLNLKIPVDSAWVKSRLRMYGLHQEESAALDRYPTFKKHVIDILKRKRDSEVSAKEQTSFTVAHRTFKDFNEDTLLNQLLPFLTNRNRLVPQSLVDRADIEEEEVQVSIDFVESGLITVSNREFSRSLPFIFTEDIDLNKAMRKDARMTNPKPDRTFAVNVEKLPWPPGFVIPARIVALTDVVRSCCHPFCLWEGKSDKGTLVDARNQACRGGATLLFWDRYLRAQLGREDVVGPDIRTFVFSVVSSPEVVEINVHWVELPKGNASLNKETVRPVYHMHRLKTKALADEEGLGTIRKLVNHILDWGIGTRFDGLAGLHQDLIDYSKKIDKEEQEAATAAKGKQSPSKKQKTG